MKSDIEYLERVREAAHLNTVEFVMLLPIDRSTYYGWIQRRRTPDPLRLKLCVARADRIMELVKEGALPIVWSHKRDHKMSHIVAMLQRQKSNS